MRQRGFSLFLLEQQLAAFGDSNPGWKTTLLVTINRSRSSCCCSCSTIRDRRAIVLDGSHCAVLSVRPDQALRKRMALRLQVQERLWQRSALPRRASLKSSGMVNLLGGLSMKSLRG